MKTHPSRHPLRTEPRHPERGHLHPTDLELLQNEDGHLARGHFDQSRSFGSPFFDGIIEENAHS